MGLQRRNKIRKRKAVARRNRSLFPVCAAGIVLCLAAVIRSWGSEETEPEISTGINRLQSMEASDAAVVEEHIRKRDKEELMASAEWQNRSPNEKMRTAVVLGDSRTQGLEEYEILDPSKVLAEIGIELTEAEPYVEQAIELNPETVFLSYGLNDIEATGGDTQLFGERYKNVIQKLKAGLPKCRIFLNTILPVQKKAEEANPYLAQLEEYNDAIRSICREEGTGCVELGELAREELYEPDGEHLKMEFYPLWVDRMAEAAEL